MHTNINKLMLLWVIVVGAILFPAKADCDVIDQWTFNEGSGLTVRSGGSLRTNGTITGANWVATPGGSGLSFDGDNDIVRFLDSSGWANGLESRSVEMWIKGPVGGFTAGIWQDVLVKSDQGASMGMYLSIVDKKPYHSPSHSSSTVLAADTWYHIVYVATYGGREYFYVNGSEVSSEYDLPRAAIISDGGELNIGGFYSSYWAGQGDPVREDFAGVIDEIIVHDTDLSAGDVLASYQVGPVVPEPATMLIMSVGGGIMLAWRRRK